MTDATYGPKVYMTSGGDKQVVASGGEIDVESGGALKIAGTQVNASAAELNTLASSGVSNADLVKLAALTASAVELNETFLELDIADGSAEAVYYLVSPHAGTISKIWTVIDDVVSTADITVTAAIGATPVTGGVVTIATAGSAAGDVDSATPSAANTVTAGQAINFTVTGGGAGGAPRIHLVCVITR